MSAENKEKRCIVCKKKLTKENAIFCQRCKARGSDFGEKALLLVGSVAALAGVKNTFDIKNNK